MNVRVVLSSLVLLLAGACAPDPVTTLKPLPDDSVGEIAISQVRVTKAPEVPEKVAEQVRLHTLALVGRCATGKQGHVLDIRVDNFKGQNPTMTILVGDSVSLSGQVRVMKPDSETVVAEYYIQELIAGAGLIGAGMLAHSDTRLPRSFAQRICAHVFKKPVEV